jgi:hypothetical protein
MTADFYEERGSVRHFPLVITLLLQTTPPALGALHTRMWPACPTIPKNSPPRAAKSRTPTNNHRRRRAARTPGGTAHQQRSACRAADLASAPGGSGTTLAPPTPTFSPRPSWAGGRAARELGEEHHPRAASRRRPLAVGARREDVARCRRFARCGTTLARSSATRPARALLRHAAGSRAPPPRGRLARSSAARPAPRARSLDHSTLRVR